MSVLTLAANTARDTSVPCRSNDPELWFSEEQHTVEVAQRLCGQCPLQEACLSSAVERKEPWGVWGGELFERGRIVAQKRPKGRPRKDADDIERRAQERLASRLAEVSVAIDEEMLGVAQVDSELSEAAGAA